MNSRTNNRTRLPFPVMDVPLSGGGVLGCCALALPMEQVLVDGVIVVHGGGRVILVSLVQGHKEHIQLLLRQHFTPSRDGRWLQEIQRNQQLVADVGAVQGRGGQSKPTSTGSSINQCGSYWLLQKGLQFAQQDRAVRSAYKLSSTSSLFQSSAALPQTVT